MTNTQSMVASTKATLDLGKLVSITNRAQGIVLLLASDALVPPEAQAYYEQANELMKKAMDACIAGRGQA